MDVQGWVVVGLAFVLFGYLVPHLVSSRQQLAQARVEDRFSGTLRVVRSGATPSRRSPREHHGDRDGRPYLHNPRRRTEAPAVNRPTTPSERAAAEARQLAAARARRAAEISRRKAAARRRLVLTVVLLVASVGGWLGFGLTGAPIALGVVPTVLLGTVLVLGRRAAKIAVRRNAADRAAMARLEKAARTAAGAERTAPGVAASRGATAAGAGRVATAAGATAAGAAHVTATEETPVPTTSAPASAGTTADTETDTATTTAAGDAGSEVETRPEHAPAQTDASPAEPAPVTVPGAGAGAGADADAEQAWTPVPVPAPAYTLKASAPRRDIAPFEPPAPEATAEATEQTTVASGLAGSPYAPVVETEPVTAAAPAVPNARGLDLDSVLARRRAVGA